MGYSRSDSGGARLDVMEPPDGAPAPARQDQGNRHRSAPETTDARVGRSRQAFVGTAAVASLGVASAATIAWLGRGWFFFFDDWGIILYRRRGGPSAFFAPHNGHLAAVVIAIYRSLFATTGLHHYGVYRGVEIVLHVACAFLLYRYAVRRGVPTHVAVLVTGVMLFLGSGAEVLFWLVNAGFIVPLIALLVALLAWDSGRRRADWVVLGALSVALASSGLGLAVAVGLAVVAWNSQPRTRRVAVVVGPVLAWVGWFALYRPGANTPASLRALPGAQSSGDVGLLGLTSHNIVRLPAWTWKSLWTAAGGLFGTATPWACYLILAGLVALAIVTVATGRSQARALAFAAALVAFWVLAGATRGSVPNTGPSTSRYLYTGCVLLLLILIELARTWRPGRLASGIATVLAIIAVVGGVHKLDGVGKAARAVFPREKAALAVLEACRGNASPNANPERSMFPAPFSAGPFWAATDALGNPVPAASPGSGSQCSHIRR